MQKVCLVGEGILVSDPTEDTGLRAAWSRWREKVIIFGKVFYVS